MDKTGDVLDEHDNCSTNIEATFKDDTVAGTCEGMKIITRTWSLVDKCGNAAADQTQTITVKDTIKPTFTAPAEITIYTDDNCNFDAGVDKTGDVLDEHDNCSTNIEATFKDDTVAGTCEGMKIITRTWSLVDDCGNAAADQKQTITVEDTIRPTYNVPEPYTAYTDDNCTAVTTPDVAGEPAEVKDNCTEKPIVTYRDEDPVEDCEGAYHFKRIWKVVDDCGNISLSDSVQLITVKDTIRPTFTKPIDTTVYRDAYCNYDASPEITGTISNVWDNCSTSFDTNYVDQDVTERYVTCEGHMVIERTWTVTDNCGNVSLPQIQFIAVRDSIRPTFTAPKDTTIYKDENCEYDITVENVGDVLDEADNCTSVLEATYRDSVITPDDACEGLLVIQRIWSLVDDCGNEAAEQNQIITIEDTLAPVFTVPEDITLCRNDNGDIAADTTVAGTVTDAADNCSADVTIEWNDTDISGTDAEDRVITREWTVTDACGNVATAEQHITVRPSVLTDGNYTLTCIGDTTVFLPYNTDRAKISLPAPDTANNMTGMSVTVTNDYPADSIFTVGVTTITWTATDECGHSISCSFNVNVEFPPCDSTVIDGYTYPAVHIGSQCWLGENLRNTVYADGSEVAYVKDYNNDASNTETYGKLYSWYSAVKLAEGDNTSDPELSIVPQPRNSNGRGKAAPTDATPGSQFVQGVCPDGWAVPTSGDYMVLCEVAGTTDKVKDSSKGWLPGYEGTEPTTGFNARGAGYYDSTVDRFMNLLGETYYWTSDSAANSQNGTCIVISYHCADGMVQDKDKKRCHSVRCIRVY